MRSRSCSATSRAPTAGGPQRISHASRPPRCCLSSPTNCRENASRGVVNQISDVKLLQGDLSEAWSEVNDEYATVAMRYSLNDKIVDRASGRSSRKSRRSHRALELPPRARRRLGALGDPAVLIASHEIITAGPKCPAILFFSAHGIALMNSKCSASSQARIVVVSDVALRIDRQRSAECWRRPAFKLRLPRS